MEKQIKTGSRVVFHGEDEDGRTYDVTKHFPDDAKYIGKAGTVTEADPCPRVRMDDGYEIYGWYEGRYEVVSEQPGFKEGDRVVIGAVSTNYASYVPDLAKYVGRAGTVKGICDDDEDARVSFENEDRSWWFPLSSLTLAESAKPAATFLIAGMTTEYTTQESAEEFLAEFGDNGKEYTITQVVRRVRVNRTANLETI